MGAALATWHMGRVIAAYRHHPHHRRTLRQDVVAGWVGISQAQLSRIENGLAMKDLDKLTHWARTLGIPARLLWFKLPGEERIRPETDGRARTLDSPYEATVTELLRETQGDVPMQRRSFLLLTGASATAPALDLLMPGAPVLRAAQDGDRVSSELICVVERTVRQARELDDNEGSGSTLLWSGGIWQNLGKLIIESRHGSAVAARLHTAYIEMSEAYGWMLFDAGHRPQAQRVYQTGIRLAREAENRPDVHRATANLLASAAYSESWHGQHQEAATLLDVADNQAPRALTPPVRAVLASRRIALSGQQGDVGAIRSAEDQARSHLGAPRDGEEPWWSRWLSPQAIDAQTGRALLAAGWPDLAEPYLSSGIASRGQRRDRMLYASELAAARLQTGDLTGACAAAHAALALADQVDSHRVHDHLARVTKTMRRDHGTHLGVRSLLAEQT
jgi:transcriptional regulator with XRE-family HTH domain